jgi:hypothetical protein
MLNAALDAEGVDYGGRVGVRRRCRSRSIAGEAVNGNDFAVGHPERPGMIRRIQTVVATPE